MFACKSVFLFVHTSVAGGDPHGGLVMGVYHHKQWYKLTISRLKFIANLEEQEEVLHLSTQTAVKFGGQFEHDPS